MYSLTPVNRAAGADAGNQDVNFAIGVVPDFGTGGFEVDLRIRRVIELLRDEAIGRLARSPCLGDCAFHSLGARGQHQFRSEGAKSTRRSVLMVSGITMISL